MSKLSRRSLVASASALPALAIASPNLAASAKAPSAQSTCTLPPDLIERFLRIRARQIESNKQFTLWSDEVRRRVYAATGATAEEWRDFNHPRSKELRSIHDKICDDVPYHESEAEGDERHAELWRVVEAIILDHDARSVVDLAWQAEALLIAYPEVLEEDSDCTSAQLIRTFFQHLRTVAAIPELSSSAVQS